MAGWVTGSAPGPVPGLPLPPAIKVVARDLPPEPRGATHSRSAGFGTESMVRNRIVGLLGNLAVALGSLAATLTVLELVVFGMLLKPDDVLPNVTINGVVRYMPDTAAVFRHPDGTETKVTINGDGWNSTRPSYTLARTPGRRRVAVVGDSYVHASFVDVGQGYPEVIERTLAARGHDVEVLRFGMDGAPLSQYLHMLRREVVRYRPDVVVVGLIHNDFDESYRMLKSRTGSSFLKVALDDAAAPVEVPPAEFKPGIADALRSFATFRYLYYETNLYLVARSVVSRLFWGGEDDFAPEHISSAVDVRDSLSQNFLGVAIPIPSYVSRARRSRSPVTR